MPVATLQDLTVVECATFVTGPYALALPGNLGARVIKIESPPDGDPCRFFAPDAVFSFKLRFIELRALFEDVAEKASARPPLVGEQRRRILLELGQRAAKLDDLRARGITGAVP